MNVFQGMHSLDFVTFNGTLHLEEFHLTFSLHAHPSWVVLSSYCWFVPPHHRWFSVTIAGSCLPILGGSWSLLPVCAYPSWVVLFPYCQFMCTHHGWFSVPIASLCLPVTGGSQSLLPVCAYLSWVVLGPYCWFMPPHHGWFSVPIASLCLPIMGGSNWQQYGKTISIGTWVYHSNKKVKKLFVGTMIQNNCRY